MKSKNLKIRTTNELILEDNAYGLFRYECQPVRPLASLDDIGCVIYLLTFSKTLSPALHIGAATLPNNLFGDRAASRALWEDLVNRKSFLTVDTNEAPPQTDEACRQSPW